MLSRVQRVRHLRDRASAPAVVSPAFLTSPRRCEVCPSSQDLVDSLHRSVGASFANTNGDYAIQECVCFGRGLESRHCSKVVTRGIDDLSTAKRGDRVWRALTQSLT